MKKPLSSVEKAYLAGFLDGDGSIYVRLKPNETYFERQRETRFLSEAKDSYKYGFQVVPYIVLFQSKKGKSQFEKICSRIDLGHLRERNDGIIEYIISKRASIGLFLNMVFPYSILKKQQIKLMKEILRAKENIDSKKDFSRLAKLVEKFRKLNYSKTRKIRTLTPQRLFERKS